MEDAGDKDFVRRAVTKDIAAASKGYEDFAQSPSTQWPTSAWQFTKRVQRRNQRRAGSCRRDRALGRQEFGQAREIALR